MTIVYPVNEGMALRKARDARILRNARALSAGGHRVHLLIGRTAAGEEGIWDYYGVSPSGNLSILQLPVLKGQGRIRITVNEVFLWAAFLAACKIQRVEPIRVFYFSVLEVAGFFLKRRKSFADATFVYELHELARYPENSDPSPRQLKQDAFEREVLSGMDGVFTTTETIRKVVAQRYPRIPSETIPLGTTPTGKNPWGNWGAGGRFKVGYLGQLYDAQGVDVFIQALAFVPPVEAHIIGGTAGEISALKRMAVDQGVDGRVVFHGFVNPGKTAEISRGMDIFVVPAKNTVRMNYVAHLKIYEYMGLSRPIVATRLRSIEEEVEDGRTGILVPPDDPRGLAEGIQKLVQNPGMAEEIADRAFHHSARYHWERRAERITAFIHSLNQLEGSGEHRCDRG
jgi:glycosyltransferase involved in cell wall biosynthesis